MRIMFLAIFYTPAVRRSIPCAMATPVTIRAATGLTRAASGPFAFFFFARAATTWRTHSRRAIWWIMFLAIVYTPAVSCLFLPETIAFIRAWTYTRASQSILAKAIHAVRAVRPVVAPSIKFFAQPVVSILASVVELREQLFPQPNQLLLLAVHLLSPAGSACLVGIVLAIRAVRLVYTTIVVVANTVVRVVARVVVPTAQPMRRAR